MTRRMSQRAQAQEIYREMVEDARNATPTPDPSPHPPSPDGLRRTSGGGEPKSAEADLTARVRALYENSAVPVREIARLAGVTERTLYKYAQKGGWKARYAWIDRGGVHRRWRATDAVAPAQGAGGRFIRREDSGKPFPCGLKATDPQGATRATAACAQAEAIAAQAQADAALLQWNETLVELLRTVRMISDQHTAYQQARRQKRSGRAAEQTDMREQTMNRLGHLALDCVEFCQAQMATLLPS